MSLTKEQFEQWTTILRSQPERQIVGSIGYGPGEPCCANGVLAYDVLGLSAPPRGFESRVYEAVRGAVGSDGLWDIERLNDQARLAFPEIADYLDAHRDKYVGPAS